MSVKMEAEIGAREGALRWEAYVWGGGEVVGGDGGMGWKDEPQGAT